MSSDHPSRRRLPFETAEYRRRLDDTRTRMAEAGLDGLVLTDPANMNYLTGYDAWSFYVPQAVVVLPEVDPVWIGREMDGGAARATTWLDPDRIRTYGDDYVQSPADRHPMDYVASILSDLGVATGRVGVEMDAYYYTARSHHRLESRLTGADLVDATLLVNRVRLRKSQAEIALMEEAGRIAAEGMRRGLDALEVGVPESAVAAAIYRGLVGGVADMGGDYPAIVPLIPSGRGTTTPHLTWSDRRLEPGDPVIVELAGVRHRYHAPLARTAYIGEPPEDLVRTADAVVEGLEAALASVRPGVTAEDVERAWRESIAAHGLEKASRLGYSCGLGYPPDWGEHTVSLRPGDETVLEAGMTFHMIPGLWLESFGVEISETFVVTEEGTRTLSDHPRGLILR